MAQTSLTGLLIVDLQRAFLPPPDMVVAIRDAVPQYDHVVALRFINKPDSLFETEIDCRSCHADDPQLALAFDPPSGVAVWDHHSYGILAGQIEQLRTLGVARWDICGCDTHACVLATCFNLFDAGIKLRVKTEWCSSSDGQALHGAALAIMQKCFGAKL